MCDFSRNYVYKMLFVIFILVLLAGFNVALPFILDFSGLTVTTISSLMIFALVTTAIPGPNTIMLMASGVNFGFKASIPHISGVVIGVPILVMLVGLGMSKIFDRVPYSMQVLKIVSVSYFLLLAWRIVKIRTLNSDKKSIRPMSFIQSVLFQWVNPSVWTMALAAIALFSSETNPFYSVLIVSAAFGISEICTTNLWVLMGHNLKRFLSDPVKLHAINIVLATLLVLTLFPFLLVL